MPVQMITPYPMEYQFHPILVIKMHGRKILCTANDPILVKVHGKRTVCYWG